MQEIGKQISLHLHRMFASISPGTASRSIHRSSWSRNYLPRQCTVFFNIISRTYNLSFTSRIQSLNRSWWETKHNSSGSVQDLKDMFWVSILLFVETRI